MDFCLMMTNIKPFSLVFMKLLCFWRVQGKGKKEGYHGRPPVFIAGAFCRTLRNCQRFML